MNVSDFHSWVRQRDRWRREHVPVADRVVSLVAQAGGRGMTRAEVGSAVGSDLDRAALDDLLTALIGAGLLSVFRQDGRLVFRAGWSPTSLQPGKSW